VFVKFSDINKQIILVNELMDFRNSQLFAIRRGRMTNAC